MAQATLPQLSLSIYFPASCITSILSIYTSHLECLTSPHRPVTQIARQSLETCTTWDCATNTLATSYIAAPVYYIMGGAEAGQGVVLTRDRHGNTTDWWKFGSGPQTCCPDIQDWYLLETNWDHWQLRGDGRQHAGITNMNNLGQKNVNADNLLNDVLYIPPTLASTTHTHIHTQTESINQSINHTHTHTQSHTNTITHTNEENHKISSATEIIARNKEKMVFGIYF